MTELLRATLFDFRPVLIAAAIYATCLLAFFAIHRAPGTFYRALLAGGVACLVHLWGLWTVVKIHTDFSEIRAPGLVLFGLESGLCLFAILLLLIPRNLVSRRIGMPTAFTLGIGASIAAVHADLLLMLWLAIP